MKKIKDWFKVWKDFDISEYKNDFKKSNWKSVFLLLTIIYAFYPTIINYAHSKISYYLIFDFNSNGRYWSIFITVLLLISVLKIYEILNHHLLPPLLSVIIIILLFFSPYYIENNSPFYFIKYWLWDVFEIRFIQIILYFILIYFIPFKLFIRTKPTETNHLSLLDDSPNIIEDLYLRGQFISHLVKHLNHTQTESSFSIGIIGGWGSGKTNVIERIKKELETDPKNIIININPWQQNGISNTITTFFDTLKDKLSYLGNSISKPINRYYNVILKENYSNDYINLISNLLKLNQKGTNEHQIINDLIKISNKKIFVFIDDIDRLTSSEIIEIFSFIRNTANFNNTFFIVPYDKNYVIDVLTNSKQFANEKEYLNKIFQLEIYLPQFKKSFYLDQIKEYLTLHESSPERVAKINFTLDKIVRQIRVTSVELNSPKTVYTNIFESLIDNIRELKRFCNSIKIILTNVGDEADLFDLIILELIKNKNFELYNAIRNEEIIENKTFNNTEVFTLKSMEFDTFLNGNPFKNALKEAIILLLGETTTKNSRSFLYPRNSYIYFSYQLFDKIPLKDFEKLTKSNEEEVINVLSDWLIDSVKNEELYTIINDINFSTDFNFFKTLNSCILQLNQILSNDNRWLLLIKNRIIQYPYTENLNEISKKSFETHVLELLENNKINPYYKAEILCEIHFQIPLFLKAISNNNILDLVEFYFLEYSKSSFVSFEQCNKFYMLLKDEGNGKTIPNNKLCTIYNSILENKHEIFENYIIHFLSTDPNSRNSPWTLSRPYLMYVNFDKWFKYIFDDVKKFKEMVDRLESRKSEKLISCIKSIIANNIDQYNFDNPSPIGIIEENDIQILRLHFRNTNN